MEFPSILTYLVPAVFCSVLYRSILSGTTRLDTGFTDKRV